MIEFIIENKLYVGYLMEFLAACAGTIHLLKVRNPRNGIKLFVGFLWFNFFYDLFGMYPIWAFYDNYQSAPFIKDTAFARNFWYYNNFYVIKYLLLSHLFILQLTHAESQGLRKILDRLKWVFLIYSIVCFASFGNYLYQYDYTVIIFGTFFLVGCIMGYLLQMLRTDQVLHFRSDLVFYIAIALILYELCIAPINIYAAYFNEGNMEFVQFYARILRYGNIYLYGMFIIGFLVTLRNARKTDTLA
ncbi:hypothetical protein [Christiangramia portivictoriae]|uniref:hypothetical protein n=1 Tax=Christiangramia portivictoriae TaxID=326069 RepID=UPI000479B221|nr:hypothetical protein [Christiangramia portivictoriae]